MKNLKLFLWLSALTGIIYPLFITVIAQVAMPFNANGRLIIKDSKIIGSQLIGQKFSSEKYFWGRPSAVDYNPLPSGGSNLSPTSSKLKAQVAERTKALMGSKTGDGIPSDLLFASGSGLDPHIFPEAAYFQLDRVLKARGLNSKEDKEKLEALIEAQTHHHFLTILAPSCINVLLLNLALDEEFTKHE